MGSVNFDKIVQQVMKELDTAKPAKSAKPIKVNSTGVSQLNKSPRTAFLTDTKRFEISDCTIPDINDDEILVEVEGCGISGCDIDLFNSPDRGLSPIAGGLGCVLGSYGTGTVIKTGNSCSSTSASPGIQPGDRVVVPSRLLETKGISKISWFTDYVVLKNNYPVFKANDLSLEHRILAEPAAYALHGVKKSRDFINFNADIAVSGCSIFGLLIVSILSSMGVKSITAIDTEESRLTAAKNAGASRVINSRVTNNTDYSAEEQLKSVLSETPQDFIFQCGEPIFSYRLLPELAGKGFCIADIPSIIREKKQDYAFNPSLLLEKELTVFGSSSYDLDDYAEALAFLRIPNELQSLITGRFALSEINPAFISALSRDSIQTIIVNA